MNDFETGTTDASEVEELKLRCAALQRQTINLLVGLIVLACTLAAFLYLQRRYAAADLSYLKPLVQAYYRDQPAIDVFKARLAEFGRTNRDFQQQVLNKYGISVAAPPAAPVPAGTAAPKPPQKK